MTTIAVSKDQIAGDKMLSHSSGISFNGGTKLSRWNVPMIYPKEFYTGYAGNVDIALQLLEFFFHPEDWKLPKTWTQTEFVVLTADKKIFTFSDPRKWTPILSKHYAIGSGSHFAMGAMECGKTPVEAVAVAAKLDKGTGYGVSSHSL